MARPARRIAFYAPLKAPDHPVPSGDRLMARQIWAALEQAGYRPELASSLRARIGDSDDWAGWAGLQQAATAEQARIAARWGRDGPPDLWFSYHPYYKSPDLIGPPLARRFGLPLITCEASWSARRNVGIWAQMQALALDAVCAAALNLCLTTRDAAGLALAAPQAQLSAFPPFIDMTAFTAPPRPEPGHIVTVAMMRAGDKLASYRALAQVLEQLPPALDWRLSIAGGGQAEAEVRALFAGLPAGRVDWCGALDRAGVAALLARGMVYLWPGYGEAYGLAYLEAQAAGLPVVAFRTAGVPEVVAPETGGALVPEGDTGAMAAAVTALLADPARTSREGAAARQQVAARHSFTAATGRLATMIESICTGTRLS